jgi:hypothetical protein
MLLGGLWHGANLKFLVWGGMHGLALTIHKLWESGKGRFSFSIPNPIAWLITFHFAVLCWLPFRAESLDDSLILARNLLLSWNFDLLPEIFQQYKLPFSVLISGYMVHFFPGFIKTMYTRWFQKMPIWLLCLVAVCTVLFVFQFKEAESQPFIYFQF